MIGQLYARLLCWLRGHDWMTCELHDEPHKHCMRCGDDIIA